MLRRIVAALAALSVTPALASVPTADAAPPTARTAPATDVLMQVLWGEFGRVWDAGWTTTDRVNHFVLDTVATDVASVDVRLSRTPARAARMSPWRYPVALQGIAPTTIELAIPIGTVLCVQARARDDAGLTTRFRDASICVSRAFGPGAFRQRGPVQVVRSDHFWSGRAKVIHYGGSLRFPGVPSGAVAVHYVSYPDNPERALEWWMPGRRSGVEFGDSGDRVRHTTPIAYVGQSARHRGTIRYGTAGYPTSLAVEGVAIMPRWMLGMRTHAAAS